MQNQLPEQLNDLNRQTLAAAQKWATLNSNLWMNLSQKQMDVLSLYMEGSVKQWQVLTENNSVEAMLQAQSAFAQDFQQQLLNALQDTSELFIDTEKQCLDLFEAQLKQVMGQVTALSETETLNPVEVVKEAVANVTETVANVTETVGEDKPKRTAKKTTARKTTKKTTKAATEAAVNGEAASVAMEAATTKQ